MTDHFGIFHLIYGIPTVCNIKYKQTRQLNEYNILKFRNILAKADYTSVLLAIDPNEAYNNFMQIYKSLFEISCPVKTTKINNKYIKREPWITSGLLVSSINKDKLLRRKLHKPNMERERMLIEHIVEYTIRQKERQRLNIMLRYWKNANTASKTHGSY